MTYPNYIKFLDEFFALTGIPKKTRKKIEGPSFRL